MKEFQLSMYSSYLNLELAGSRDRQAFRDIETVALRGSDLDIQIPPKPNRKFIFEESRRCGCVYIYVYI